MLDDVNLINDEEIVGIDSLNEESNDIILLNIRSMRANFEQFKDYIFRDMRIKPRILILVEVWIKDHEINMYSLDGYKTYHDLNLRGRAGGVIIYVSELVVSKNEDIQLGEGTQSVALKCQLNNGKKWTTILGVYRSPSMDKVDFVTHLENWLMINKNIKSMIFTGDINIDLNNRGKDKTVDLYYNLMTENGLYYYETGVTRVGVRNKNNLVSVSKSILDHVFIKNAILKDFSVRPLKWTITDHLPIGIKTHINKNNNTIIKTISQKGNVEIEKTFFDIKCMDIIMDGFDIATVTSLNDSNMAANKLTEFLKYAIKKSTVKVIKNGSKIRSSKKLDSKEYVTEEIKNKIKLRDAMFRAIKNNNINDSKLINKHKLLRNQIKRDILRNKHNFYGNLIKNNSDNIKKQYSIVKEYLNMPGKADLTKLETWDTNDKDSVLNEFNIYFTEVGEKISIKAKKSSLRYKGNRNLNTLKYHDKSMFMTETNIVEIEKLIDEININKMPGDDGINGEIIKRYKNKISICICHIGNLILNTGVFPEIYKESLIIPVHKKGDKKLFENYRPISILNIFAKLIEKVIYVRTVDFVEKNNILSNKQFGFRKNRSTEDAIALLTERVLNALDSKQSVITTYLDMSKAFDGIEHSKLIDKLSRIGIRGVQNNLFATGHKEY